MVWRFFFWKLLGSVAHGLRLQAVSNTSPDLQAWVNWRQGEDPLKSVDGKAPPIKNIEEERLTLCAPMTVATTPSLEQFDEGLNDEIAYKMIAQTDHIYFLCAACDRKFPTIWKDKVSMVNVHEVDECLDIDSHIPKPSCQHGMCKHSRRYEYRASQSHRLMVWSAKVQGHQSAAILEQDYFAVSAREKSASGEDEKAALLDFARSGKWDVLQLGWIARQMTYEKEGSCPDRCLCEKQADHVCKVPAQRDLCALRSSVSYLIKDTAYDDFVAKSGVIDYDILPALHPSYVVPDLLGQASKMEDGALLNGKFQESCVHEMSP